MDNLAWGLQITVLGMGLVFALLALLWGLLTLVLKLDRAPADIGPSGPAVAADPLVGQGVAMPGQSAVPSDEGHAAGPAQASVPDPAMVAAITLAIAAHQARQRSAAEPHMRIHWPGSLLHASRWVAAGRARQTRSWRRGG